MEFNIDASYYTGELEGARKSNAPAITFAGIYNAQFEYHLMEAINKAAWTARDSGILASIDYESDKYRDYAVAAKGVKDDRLVLDKEVVDSMHIRMDDIATAEGKRYIVKGAENIAKWETRQHIYNAENSALFTDPNIVPFEPLHSQRQRGDYKSGYTDISDYAALHNFATGQRGDLLAALKTLRETGASALKTLPDHTRTVAERQLEAMVATQEKLLLPPVQKLMNQRRDLLDAMLKDRTFPPEVEQELRAAAEAAHQAAAHMEAHTKSMGAKLEIA